MSDVSTRPETDITSNIFQIGLVDSLESQIYNGRASSASTPSSGNFARFNNNDLSSVISSSPVVKPRFSSTLVGFFAAGLLVSVVGLILLLANIFVGIDVLNLAASVLLAIGSTTVAITLLRG